MRQGHVRCKHKWGEGFGKHLERHTNESEEIRSLRLWQLTHPDRKQPEVWPGVESHAPLVAILCAGEHVRQSEHAGRVTRNGAIITCSSVETAAARARDNIPTRVAGVGAPAACRAAEWLYSSNPDK